MPQAVVPVRAERFTARQEIDPFALLQNGIERLFYWFRRNFPAFSAHGANLPRMDVSEIIARVNQLQALARYTRG
jgi:hypothetical protein